MDTLQLIQQLLSANFPNYPFFRQGSMTPKGPWPPIFITYWQWAGRSVSHYDNHLHTHTMEFDINIYGSDAQAVYTAIENMVFMFKKNDFQVINYTRDRRSDREGYIGQGVTIQYIQVHDEGNPIPKL
jgi:hypothetical protein